jgi:predicted  nucleic acid-binding Zn-ribbon protein
MANVRRYTEQIASAKKGKDVRAAIVSAINEVSDENNTYNQTKADIQAAQKSINADVTKNQQTQQAFNSNLQEAKEVQKDLTAKMNKGTTLAENLEKKNTTATSLDKSLGEKNTAATKTVQTLEADITAAGQAERSLEADVTAANKAAQTLEADTTAAGKAKQSLEADITAAGQAERSLEADVTAAGEAKTKLDASIKTSGENITTMQNLVQNADQIKTGLETDLNNAQQASKDLKQNTAASVTKIETAGQTQIDLIKQNGGGVENALSNYFALRRNGKVFTTKIYKWETSTSPVGVKMNANENMVAEPSVGRTEGRDDYAQYGLFHHFTCNFSVDENGFNHVDALEGQIGFTKYGKVQVGEVTMSAWFGIEDTTEAVLYHYSDSQTELTPYPMKESINPDGTISPFMIHAKYAAGDIDGVPYSSKGLAPANGCQATQARNPVSYTGMITYMHKLGGHYCGTTSWDLFYRQLMMIIKYATTHSQSIMAGCTSYSNQNQNLVEETGVMRVVLTKAQAAGYVIGSYVSIGDVGSNTNKDRYFSYIHNKAYSVKVTKIEDVDDSNAAVYVDAPEAFDTTLTTWITTMPWHSGATDEVAGSDGSPNSNTNGKDPYKIQGIETCIGAYEVLGNVVMDIVTGPDGNPARDVYVCEDASTLSSNIATVRANYKKAIAQVAYTAASWKYITEETTDPNLGIMIPTKVGGGSTTGFADGLYTDAGTSGQREWLALGNLNLGANAGLWILPAYNGWSNTSWVIVSGVSPNGTRGEWQATA